MTEALPQRDPQRVVVVAYLLAIVCLVVPLAVVGAAFAGVALMRRNRRADGAGVLVVAGVATALGLILLR